MVVTTCFVSLDLESGYSTAPVQSNVFASLALKKQKEQKANCSQLGSSQAALLGEVVVAASSLSQPLGLCSTRNLQRAESASVPIPWQEVALCFPPALVAWPLCVCMQSVLNLCGLGFLFSVETQNDK